MKVVINAVSAKMGGALSYVRNFLPTLAGLDAENEYTVFMQSSLVDEFASLAPNIHVATSATAESGERGRLIFDQWKLRCFIKRERIDCIFSIANFAVLHPPCAQVLSVRNPVYFCRRYYPHVRAFEGRLAEARIGLRRRMVAWSCASSDTVVTPTAAMRDMLFDWGAADPGKCTVIHHGFDGGTFLAMKGRLSQETQQKVARRGDETLLLYPSLYARHKNFDTLMRCLDELRGRGRRVRLLLTCRVDPEADPYQRGTHELIARLGLGEMVVTLGNQPYRNMPLIYEAADMVVWPTFAESFGHPLLETMACRRPIVASGIPVNREMAGEAALYFETFDEKDFADKVEAALETETARSLVEAGARRVEDFSWKEHVAAFVALFEKCGKTARSNTR